MGEKTVAVGDCHVEIIVGDSSGIVELMEAYSEIVGVAHERDRMLGLLHVSDSDRCGAHSVPEGVEVYALMLHPAIDAVEADVEILFRMSGGKLRAAELRTRSCIYLTRPLLMGDGYEAVDTSGSERCIL